MTCASRSKDWSLRSRIRQVPFESKENKGHTLAYAMQINTPDLQGFSYFIYIILDTTGTYLQILKKIDKKKQVF